MEEPGGLQSMGLQRVDTTKWLHLSRENRNITVEKFSKPYLKQAYYNELYHVIINLPSDMMSWRQNFTSVVFLPRTQTNHKKNIK